MIQHPVREDGSEYIRRVRLGGELETIGYDGEASTGEASHVYLKLHVEQELVLDADDVQIGIVGMSWADVCITGQSIQAGPPPMHMRNDLMTAARDAAHVINKRPQS